MKQSLAAGSCESEQGAVAANDISSPVFASELVRQPRTHALGTGQTFRANVYFKRDQKL